jgi:hypothetical protein
MKKRVEVRLAEVETLAASHVANARRGGTGKRHHHYKLAGSESSRQTARWERSPNGRSGGPPSVL